MRISQTLVLSVFFFLYIQSTLAARRGPNELREHIKSSIKTALPDLRGHRNLRNVYYLYRAGLELKADVAKIATELQLCANLKKLSLSDLPEGESQAYLVDLSRLANCSHKDEKSAKVVETLTKSNLASEYIVGTLLGLDTGAVKKNGAACTRAVDFFAGDGTSVIDLNDKTQKTLYYTPFLLEIVERCETKPGILQSAVKNLLLNTYPIYRNGLSLVEGDSVFIATSHLVNGILSSDSLRSLKEFQEKLNALAFFIQAHAQHIQDGEELFAYARVSNRLNSTLFFELDNAVFDLSKKANWELTGSLYNINFQPAKAANVTLTGTLSKTGEKVTFAPKKDSYAAKFGSNIAEPGYYQLKVDLNAAGQTSSFNLTILVRKKIQVDTARFDVALNNKRPSDLANEVKGGKSFGEVLKSNQNGFVFVSFKVSGIENPAEVVLRLIHPQYLDATGTIPAKFNKDTYHYEAVLDLGNPDVIQPYNGEYKLNLTVADLYGENVVEWTLASLLLTFTKNQQGHPPADSDYKLLPEIKHIFPLERIKPNPLITTVFAVLSLIALLGFFYGLGVLKVNFGRYPSSGLGPIFALLFVVDILVLLGILTWFWLEINLFQTLGLLSIAIIPTVVIGNLTFSSLETHDDNTDDEPLKQAATEEEHKKEDVSKGDKKGKTNKAGKKPKDE